MKPKKSTTQLTLQQVKNRLQLAGYKLTSQREAAVQVLLQHQEMNLTAEELYMRAKATGSDIGLATVYRSLELLTELGISNKVTWDDGVARYVLNDFTERSIQHRLICERCGSVVNVDQPDLIKLEQSIEHSFSFQMRSYSVSFKGLCNQCQQSSLG